MRVLLAAVSLVFALALGELATRLFLDPPSRVVFAAQQPAEDFEPRELSLDRVPDRGGLYLRTPTGLRLRPNTHAVLRGERLSGRTLDIRTNSLGYRGPEVSARQGRRILFLGDSITFANYLDEGETFVKIVEVFGELRGQQWNTINAGVGTISLGNELAILEESGLSVEPDVVVLAFYLNDFHESPGVFIEAPPPALAWSRVARIAWGALRAPYEASDDGDAPLFEAVRLDLEDRLDPARTGDRTSWRTDPRAFEALVLDQHRDWGGAWSEPAWAVMTPLLEELRRLSRVHDFELVFVAFPVRFQVEAEFVDDRPQRRLAQVAAALDVPMLDLLDTHRRATALGKLFYDHCHHTPLGARVVAEAITDFLADVLAERTGVREHDAG